MLSRFLSSIRCILRATVCRWAGDCKSRAARMPRDPTLPMPGQRRGRSVFEPRFVGNGAEKVSRLAVVLSWQHRSKQSGAGGGFSTTFLQAFLHSRLRARNGRRVCITRTTMSGYVSGRLGAERIATFERKRTGCGTHRQHRRESIFNFQLH